MDEKAPRQGPRPQPPGGVGRKSGIDIGQSIPDYEGPAEPRVPVRRPAKPAPSTDALPELTGTPPPEATVGPPSPAPPEASVPPPATAPAQLRPAPPPQAPLRPAPAPAVAPRPAVPSPEPAVPPPGLLGDPYDVEPVASEPGSQAEPEPPVEPEPPRRHTSRLNTTDFDMGSSAKGNDNLGIKFKSDRSRWW